MANSATARPPGARSVRATSVRLVSRGLSAALLVTLVAPVSTGLAGTGHALAQPAATARTAGAEVYRRPASGIFQFEGHGWGHGHGMSQWGAQGAATLGKTWQEIVAFYYPNTTVVPVPASQDSIRVWISGDDETDLRVFPATGLTVTDAATGATAALPATAGVDMWRVAQTSTTQQVQQRVNGTWQPFAIGGVTDFAGPLELARPSVGWLTLALPGDVPAKYRGVLRAARTSPSTMDTVDVLPMDEYLKGVVPHESPASFLPAALAAQAVAARSYAAYKRAHASSLSSGKYFDICDSTSCQVYGGMTGEASSTNTAVDATTGQTIEYNGQPAFTEFSSSNGGWSTDGGTPYLVAQADPWDGAAPNTVHTWTGQITAAQLEAAYPAVGHLDAITVLTRDGNGEWGGRVLNVQLTGTGAGGIATSVAVTGRSIFLARDWPTYRSPDGLRSSWWRITNLDARVVAVSPGRALVATTAPEGHATLTARLLVQGTESFVGSSLTLVPVGSTPAGAVVVGRFVGNVTTPGSATAAPGETVQMALDVDVAHVTAGSYTLSYRLSDGTSTFGDTVTWPLIVRARSLQATVAGTAVVGPAGQLPRVAGTTVALQAAGSTTLAITVRNTGNVTWPLDGSVVLATSPAGRVSQSAAATWLQPDTPAAITAAGQAGVAPGATAQVLLTLAGNGVAAGSTSETFRLTWLGTRDLAGLAFTVRRAEPVAGLGRLTAGLSAYVDGAKRLLVVTSGPDADATQRFQGRTTWSRATSLGGPVLGRATSVLATDGRSVTVARGLDGQLWLRTSASPAWQSQKVAIRDEPSAAALPNGRMQLVARGPDGTVRTAIWSPVTGVGPWSRVGTTVFASGVAATNSAAGVIISAVTAGGSVYVNRLTAGRWTGWVPVGQGASDAGPALASAPGSAVVNLFVRGTDGALHSWTRLASGTWGAGVNLGGAISAGPGAVAITATNIQVFARGVDGRVHVRRFGPGGWQRWSLAF
ncbi:MAG: stage sporulation protein [Frankiaceae bacterium]|nr:stage sporulation protein [Frankiaceae bacterium]